ncbi:MAG: aldose 1-epimerase family protein [Lachnospiraceae bacterium]|nr:aldose 1-epimerase family protein [Lachnospiraceae bacterium]
METNADGEQNHYLRGGQIQIMVRSTGAELRSLKDMGTGREYMWQADPAFWGRTSPILFPIVGGCRNGEYRCDGRTYSLPQHGFARDMEFEMAGQEQDEIWLRLTDQESTWENYPFAFVLELGYRLRERSVEVMWRVKNPADRRMYFSIGGHPAFCVPVREDGKTTCYIGFDGAKKILSRGIEGGLAADRVREYSLMEGGLLPVSEELFERDALVIENNQTQKVQLLNEDRKEFLSVAFDAPLFGVWTPPKKNAPFICIEPWYGRCDRVDFAGSIEEREWGNSLAPGETFEASYTIAV